MKRTPELDQKEKEVVAIAEEILCTGGETGNLHGFVVEGVWICNPMTTENGMGTINPEEYYGEQYITWYNTL